MSTENAEPLTTDPRPYRLKASVLRGYASVLQTRGELDAVLAGVTPAARGIIVRPPISTLWMDPEPVDEIMAAVEARGGLPAVKRLARAGLELVVVPLLRPIIEGLLRIFGASPSVLFRRMDLMSASTLRGVAFTYTEHTARAATIDADIYGPAVPMSRFVRFTAAYELMIELCGGKPRVSDPVLVAQGPWGSRARCELAWEK